MGRLDARSAPVEARLTEEQLRDLTSSLPHLVWTCLAEGPCDYLSRQWIEYTGIAETEQLGYGWLLQLHAEDRERVKQEWATTVGAGMPFDIEFRIRRHDGVHKWFRTRAIPLRDAEGRIDKWYGSNTDIDDYKRSTESLRTSEERLRLAQQVARVGTFEWNVQTGINVWTPELEAIYGLEPGTFDGTQQSWEQLVHRDDRGVATDLVSKALETFSPVEGEWRVCWPDGSIHWLVGRFQALKDEAGRLHRLVGVNVDITKRKQAEYEVLRLNDLAAENRRVHEASRMKSEFLANMSHELRTPLNSIIGFGELLNSEEVGAVSATQGEFIANIVASGRHLLGLINDILDLSKVEAGKLEFRPERVVPAVLLGEVAAILRTAAAARGVHLITEVEPGLDEVVIDPARLKQVLYNYLSNAIKFTSAGGTVTVRVFAVSSEEFMVEVHDTGIGIAPEDIPRLFVEFQQLDAGFSKRHGGTGLGLALTRKLVEAQGGQVAVTSVVGRGSVFSALLPRQTRTQTQKVPILVETAPALGPAVLVVEDNAEDSAAIVASLQAAGYTVDVAGNAAEAIAKCQERPYRALTLDLILPDGSGLDVLRTIRCGGPNQDVKVVVITVVPEPGAVAGFAVDDMLGKPFDPGALVSSLRRSGVMPTSSNGGVWVVDDDMGSRKLMAATLEQLGFHTVAFASGLAVLQHLQHATPVAVVVDLLMPEMDGFELIDRLRSVHGYQTLPIIVWTVKDLTADEYDRLRRTAQLVIAKGSGAGAGLANVLRTVLPDGDGATDGG